MKSKLKARFLPPIHFQNNYSQLRYLTPTLPTFYEGCMLTHKVKHPMKTEPLRREVAKPLPKGQPFDKGSPSTPTVPSNPKPNFIKPPLNPHEKRRCYKCQGFGHIASECSNRRIISLAEWEEKEVHLKGSWGRMYRRSEWRGVTSHEKDS